MFLPTKAYYRRLNITVCMRIFSKPDAAIDTYDGDQFAAVKTFVGDVEENGHFLYLLF